MMIQKFKVGDLVWKVQHAKYGTGWEVSESQYKIMEAVSRLHRYEYDARPINKSGKVTQRFDKLVWDDIIFSNKAEAELDCKIRELESRLSSSNSANSDLYRQVEELEKKIIGLESTIVGMAKRLIKEGVEE